MKFLSNNVCCQILFFRNFVVCICITKILNFEIVKFFPIQLSFILVDRYVSKIEAMINNDTKNKLSPIIIIIKRRS